MFLLEKELMILVSLSEMSYSECTVELYGSNTFGTRIILFETGVVQAIEG